MAQTYIGKATGTTSAALSGISAGELLVCVVYNSTNNNAATTPSGYTSVLAAPITGSTARITVFYKIAAGGETTTGTISNATRVVVLRFSGAATGLNATATNFDIFATYPALGTLNNANSTVLGILLRASGSDALTTAPTGFSTVLDSATNTAVYRTAATSSFTAKTQEMDGFSATAWVTISLEIKESVPPISATLTKTNANDTLSSNATLAISAATGSAGATAWTPANLDSAKRVGWFDAQDAATITQSAGAVSAWSNKFGTSAMANLTEAFSSVQPVYSATAFNAGYGGVTFTNDYLDSTITGLGNNITGVYIMDVNGASSGDGRFMSMGTGPDWDTGGALVAVDGSGNLFWFVGGSDLGHPVAASTLPCVVSAQFQSGGATFRQNGLQISSNTLGIGFASPTNMRVGSDWNSGSGSVNATIAEIVFLKDATADDIAKIEAYAMWKRGLQGTLNAAHPYKSAAPTVIAVTPNETNDTLTATSTLVNPITATLGGSSAPGPVAGNLMVDPENLVSSNWGSGTGGISVSSDPTAPLGDGTNMWKFETGGNFACTWSSTTISVSAGENICFEFYAKAGVNSNYWTLDWYNGSSDPSIGGPITAGASLSANDVGATVTVSNTDQTGIVRVAVQWAASYTGTLNPVLCLSQNGSVVSFPGACSMYYSRPTLRRASSPALPLTLTVAPSLPEANDTLSSSSVIVTTTISATLDKLMEQDTLAAVATVPVTTSLNKTEANDTLGSNATLEVRASLAISLADDVLSSAGTLEVHASTLGNEEDDTVAATTVIGFVGLNGALNRTEADDTLTAASTLRITASATIVEAFDTCVASTIGGSFGALAGVEGNDTVGSLATVRIGAHTTAQEANDTLAATYFLLTIIRASGVPQEANDTLASQSRILMLAALAATEVNDTLVSNITLGVIWDGEGDGGGDVFSVPAAPSLFTVPASASAFLVPGTPASYSVPAQPSFVR
jgi:hypothetical protein